MKRRNSAEEIFNDITGTIKEKTKDIERTVNEYTSKMPLRPFIDVFEDGEQITVITDLPGVKREDIKIDITENTLEVTAQFNEDTEVEGKTFVRKERKYGKVNRTVTLPAKIKIDEASAKFENGVMTVVLPKLEMKQSFEVRVD
jgi:HSP20 family protein